MRYRGKMQIGSLKTRKADKAIQWPIWLGWLPFTFCTQSTWMLTNKSVLWARVIKREGAVKRIVWTVCPQLIKKEANRTIVWKRAWLVKAQCLFLLALQLQSIKKRKKKKERRKTKNISPSSWKQKIKKGSAFQLLILRLYCLLFGGASVVSCSHVWAACKSVNIPNFSGIVLQWEINHCTWKTIIYLCFKLNYFLFFIVMFCVFFFFNTDIYTQFVWL